MDEKNKSIRNVSTAGIIFNIFLLVIKIIIGVISKSQAMLADGINSAGDIFASLMSYIGNKISALPKMIIIHMVMVKQNIFFLLLYLQL